MYLLVCFPLIIIIIIIIIFFFFIILIYLNLHLHHHHHHHHHLHHHNHQLFILLVCPGCPYRTNTSLRASVVAKMIVCDPNDFGRPSFEGKKGNVGTCSEPRDRARTTDPRAYGG